jgi:hypothetical protein
MSVSYGVVTQIDALRINNRKLVNQPSFQSLPMKERWRAVSLELKLGASGLLSSLKNKRLGRAKGIRRPFVTLFFHVSTLEKFIF